MTIQKITFGIFSDLHYSYEDDGDRLRTLTLQKLTEAITFFKKSNVDFILNIGDTIDLADSIDNEKKLCEGINNTLREINVPVYHVIGNHDVAMFDKQEFISEMKMPGAFYSFIHNGFKVCILDGNCHENGSDFSRNNFSWDNAWISKTQLKWLENELLNSDYPVVVCCHERIDGEYDDLIVNPHVVRNYIEVDNIINKSNNLIAVFSGHEHGGNISYINDIPYITCPAMVVSETPAYAIVELTINKNITITGKGRFPSLS